MKGAGTPYQRTCVEWSQVQRAVVQRLLNFRVGGQEDLEAPIQSKSVHFIRPHPPADAVGCFEHHHVQPTRSQSSRAIQTRETGADNDRIAIDDHFSNLLHLHVVCCLRQSAEFGSRPTASSSGHRPQLRGPNDQKPK